LASLLALPGNFPKIPELQIFRTPSPSGVKISEVAPPIVSFLEVFGNGGRESTFVDHRQKDSPDPCLSIRPKSHRKTTDKNTVSKAIFCCDFKRFFFFRKIGCGAHCSSLSATLPFEHLC